MRQVLEDCSCDILYKRSSVCYSTKSLLGETGLWMHRSESLTFTGWGHSVVDLLWTSASGQPHWHQPVTCALMHVVNSFLSLIIAGRLGVSKWCSLHPTSPSGYCFHVGTVYSAAFTPWCTFWNGSAFIPSAFKSSPWYHCGVIRCSLANLRRTVIVYSCHSSHVNTDVKLFSCYSEGLNYITKHLRCAFRVILTGCSLLEWVATKLCNCHL